MSIDKFKKVIKDQKLICPACQNPITTFEKYVETTAAIWDGAGDSTLETGTAKVTLICGNNGCSWKERTEYWDNYLLN